MSDLLHNLAIAKTQTSPNPLPIKSIVALSLLAVALTVGLVVGPKPWDNVEALAERIVNDSPLRPSEYVAMTLMWALAGSLIIVCFFLITVKWWVSPLSHERIEGPGAMPRRLLLCLLGIVLLGGGLRWNLAHEGLWWDELWQTRNTTVGYYKGKPDQPIENRRFLEGSLERSLWLYRLPTNHPVASTPARLMYLLTRDETDPAKFDEFALRFPGYFAGLTSIFLLGWLGWRIGGGMRTALLVALFLAIHPWHIRYSVDLRCYTWLVLWSVIAMHCLQSLSYPRSSKWGPLFGLGMVQFLIMWSSVQAVWLSLGIFATAIFLVTRGWGTKKEKFAAARRVVFVHALAAIPFSLLWSPLLPQTLEFLERYEDSHLLDFNRLERLIGEVLFGFPESEDFFLRSPLTTIAASLLVTMGFFRGIHWLRSLRKNQVAVVVSVLLGGTLALIYYWLAHTFFYQRFVIYLLPAVLLVIVCGWANWSSDDRRQWVSVCAIGFFLFLGVSWPEIKILNTRPYEPLRDLAEYMDDPDTYPIGYSHGVETMDVYLPQLRRANNLAELRSHLNRAEESGKTPMIAYGHELFNRSIAPDGFEILDDRERFEVVKTFHGIEPRFTYQILMKRSEDTGSDR